MGFWGPLLPFPGTAAVPLSFTVNLQPRHVRDATRGIFRRQVLKPGVLAGLAGLLVLGQALLWALLPKAGGILHGMLAVLMLVSVWGALALAGRHYESLALSNFRRFEGQPAQARLDLEGYHYQANWGAGTVPWGRVDSLWCLPEVWVLLEHTDKGVSVLLPLADLDTEAQAYLKVRLRERGAELRA